MNISKIKQKKKVNPTLLEGYNTYSIFLFLHSGMFTELVKITSIEKWEDREFINRVAIYSFLVFIDWRNQLFYSRGLKWLTEEQLASLGGKSWFFFPDFKIMNSGI